MFADCLKIVVFSRPKSYKSLRSDFNSISSILPVNIVRSTRIDEQYAASEHSKEYQKLFLCHLLCNGEFNN